MKFQMKIMFKKFQDVPEATKAKFGFWFEISGKASHCREGVPEIVQHVRPQMSHILKTQFTYKWLLYFLLTYHIHSSIKWMPTY